MIDASRKRVSTDPKSQVRVEDILLNLPGFDRLEAPRLGRLAAAATKIDAPRGALLFRRGDPCTGFHALVYGLVKISLQTDHGDEKVVEIMGPGSSFGEAALLLDRPHLVTAEALDDSKLLHVPREAVLHELRQDSQFSHWLIMRLSDRLYQRTSELEDYFLRTGTERVIAYLLNGDSDSRENRCCVCLPTKKGVIASRLNLTHEHFSRILHELIAASLIEVHGREVHIVDKLGLREHAKRRRIHSRHP